MDEILEGLKMSFNLQYPNSSHIERCDALDIAEILMDKTYRDSVVFYLHSTPVVQEASQ